MYRLDASEERGATLSAQLDSAREEAAALRKQVDYH